MLVSLGSVWSFVMFWGQTFKNIHDVWNMFLRKSLGVFMCLSVFYFFIFFEIGVACSYDLENYV